MPHKKISLSLAALASCLLIAGPATAQTDTTNVPLPPAERLAELESFFGFYAHTDNEWMGIGPFRGTLEVRPAIKGWYVEWIINTRHGPIDRQLRMLTTWDDQLGHYRVWRFETVPQSPPGTIEGEARFDGEEFIMEWKNSRGPDGRRGTFRNRVRMVTPNELVIISEAEPEGGGLVHLSDWRNVRVGAGADTQNRR